jgi:phosphomannomutase
MGLVESFSGVRGVYGKDITLQVASDYSAAFCSTLKSRPTIVIGRDSRPSGMALMNAMIRRLSGSAKIISLALSSTPAIELMVRKLKADGGIMITASHNEPEYNGWKFLGKSGAVLEPMRMDAVIRAYRKGKSPKQGKKAPVRKLSSVKPYNDFLLSFLTKKDIMSIRQRRFKIWFDPNGGASTPYLKGVIKSLNLDAKIINPKRFARLVEPNAKSLSPLSKRLPVGAIGIGFDCDADRAELVLRSKFGPVLSGQYLLALVVQSVLERKKGTVVTNDATSGIVSHVAHSYGCRIKEVEVGETNVVTSMAKLKSTVGGEGSSSGGVVPPSRCRDGLLSLVMILRLLAKYGKTIDELLEELPLYHTPRKNIKITLGAGLMDQLAKKLKQAGARVVRHGGKSGSVKGFFPYGWVWFRGSKTEAGVFRVIADSAGKSEADKLLKRGLAILKRLY